MKHKILRLIIIIVIAIFALACGYFAYAYLTYYRLDDNLILNVDGKGDHSSVNLNKDYTLASFNTGFGAYSDDYTFFMDGGKESWAFSKEAVYNNLAGGFDAINAVNPDFYFLQELDLDGTRSYHFNEAEYYKKLLGSTGKSYSTVFAQNYDSPFLLYPLTQPHGKNKAGIMTVSNYDITKSIRRSLPVEEGFSKFYDLDRCYSKSYINIEGTDKKLVLYNVHLSAYTTDPGTAEEQITVLNEDMISEYEAGNYCIAGGDMNKDLLGDSSTYFKKLNNGANWAKPFPKELLDSSLTITAPFNEANPIPTCRNVDAPYTVDTFVLTIDGFITTANVSITETNVINASFKYSDHNPVYIKFRLN